MATETDPNIVTPGVEQEQQLSAEVLALAEKGRTGAAAVPEFRPQDQGKPQRPANVPEKFWDAEKRTINQDALLKSYVELEKMRGVTPPPADETPEAKAARELAEKPAEQKVEETDAEKTERERKEAEAATPEAAKAVAFAQEDYAKNGGELSNEAREALVKSGIPNEAIDNYLQGVKAQERAIKATAQEAAGGLEVDDLLKWAGENLDEAQIEYLNTGLANPKTLAATVQNLAGQYRSTHPTEGRLTNLSGGTNYGDVYTSNAEYLADMAAAEKSGDNNARSKAVQKLSRSRKAGTIKAVTPRRGPFGG